MALLLADKRSPQTRRAYAADLRALFGWMAGATEPAGDPEPAAVRTFCGRAAPEIAVALMGWKAAMLAGGLAEATVNRRLAAARSMLKLAARIGISVTDGRGMVEGERAESYRDTRGIGVDAVKRLLRAPMEKHSAGMDTHSAGTEKHSAGTEKHSAGTEKHSAGSIGAGIVPLRDRALLSLLCENALRRAEVSSADVADFDPAGRRLMILGKGKGSQRSPVTLSVGCAGAIAAYLAAAGHAHGALFRNVARGGRDSGGRLTADGIYRIVGEYGRRIGVANLSPHKLRHSAITAALDATGGNVRKVQRLSRHAKLDTLMKYDDNRSDAQGEVSELLSQLLK